MTYASKFLILTSLGQNEIYNQRLINIDVITFWVGFDSHMNYY